MNTLTCPECSQVEPSRVLMVTKDGHAHIRTFTGRSVACSSDGRRVLACVPSRLSTAPKPKGGR